MNKTALSIVLLFCFLVGFGAPLAMPVGSASAQPASGKLLLAIAPPVLPADGATIPVLYVQLQNAASTPRVAAQETRVSFSSSNPSVAIAPDEVILGAGESMAVGTVTTSLLPGRATITAFSPGLGSTSVDVVTVNPHGAVGEFKLKLTAAPGKMYRGSAQPGLLAVAVLGSNDLPAPVAQDLAVVLTSSSPTVAGVARDLTIPRGQYFTMTEFRAGEVGRSSISAVASGYLTGSIEVNITEPAAEPTSLAVYLIPDVLSPDPGGSKWRAVVAQAIDRQGRPAPLPQRTVYLASSRPSVGTVEPIATSGGPAYAAAVFQVGGQIGSTSVTASAEGLETGSAPMRINGLQATKLAAYVPFASSLVSDRVSNYLVIQVQGPDGNPAPALDPLTVKLTFAGALLPDALAIPRGGTFAVAPWKGSGERPTVTISAVAGGLSPATATAGLVTVPLTLQVRASPPSVLATETSVVTATLLAEGQPVAGAGIRWTASSGEINARESVTDAKGEASVTFRPASVGEATIDVQASKSGFAETKGSIKISVGIIVPEEKRAPAITFWGIRIPVLLAAVVIAGVIAIYLVVYLVGRRKCAS